MTSDVVAMPRDTSGSKALPPLPPLVSLWLPVKLISAGFAAITLLALQSTPAPVQVNLVIDAALIIVILGAVWRGGVAVTRVETATLQGTLAVAELKTEVGRLREAEGARGEKLVRMQATLETLERGQTAMATQVGGALQVTQDLKERANAVALKAENLGILIGELRHDVETALARQDGEIQKLRDWRHDLANEANVASLQQELSRRKAAAKAKPEGEI